MYYPLPMCVFGLWPIRRYNDTYMCTHNWAKGVLKKKLWVRGLEKHPLYDPRIYAKDLYAIWRYAPRPGEVWCTPGWGRNS